MRSEYKKIEIRLIQHNGKTKKIFINTCQSIEKVKNRIEEILNSKI